MNNGHSRETGNMGYTRSINVREYIMGNKTWTFQRNWQHGVHNKVREYLMGNKQWTFQRNWQHKVHKTQDK